ncbi:hypothetical protein CDAR_387711 [Caerostris darwini]|uniref:Uncharacterized protein n=1 Tax=Caerostris darwini TaxID=1538125 RepID=A0AAV4W478_9ARAC|nr:hypothetical protein CDAR_387711 [Caerostris darwini]
MNPNDSEKRRARGGGRVFTSSTYLYLMLCTQWLIQWQKHISLFSPSRSLGGTRVHKRKGCSKRTAPQAVELATLQQNGRRRTDGNYCGNTCKSRD